jgi:hypothetical protein
VAEADHAELGGAVGRRLRKGTLAQRGGNRHHAAAGFLQVRQGGTDHRHRPHQVDPNDALPLIRVHILQLAAAVNSGCRHHCVQAIQRLSRLPDSLAHRGTVRNVDLESLRSSDVPDIAVQHHGRTARLQDSFYDGGPQA